MLSSEQALAVRNHWEIAGDHSSVAKHLARHGLRSKPASAEIIRSDRRDTTAHPVIERGEAHVRVQVSSAQRRNSSTAVVVTIANVVDVHNIKA